MSLAIVLVLFVISTDTRVSTDGYAIIPLYNLQATAIWIDSASWRQHQLLRGCSWHAI